MPWMLQFGLAALLLTGAAASHVNRLFPENEPRTRLPAGVKLPELPPAHQVDAGDEAEKKKRAASGERLRPESRIEIQRYVNGEFARVVRSLPSAKKGYRVLVGQPVNERDLRQAVANNGSAGNPGDTVQVTRIQFKNKEVWVDINGGPRGRRSWRDRLQVSVGGLPTVSQTQGPPGYQAAGAMLVLEFDQPLPDMSPDELKEYLAQFLDFSAARSAAVHWFETLPPEFQQAITEKRVMVGMDREMVVAALGKPEKKVRERTPEGLETEDWIYGTPPGKTIFVKFAGDQVIEVKEFPQ